MKKKIGIITAGADCAGINSTIRWLVYSALDKDLAPLRGMLFSIIGIRDGYKGLIELNPDKKGSMEKWAMPLDAEHTRTWDRYGGTRLGSSRINPFDPAKDLSERIVENYKKLRLDALIVMGGVDGRSCCGLRGVAFHCGET